MLGFHNHKCYLMFNESIYMRLGFYSITEITEHTDNVI